MSLSDQDLIRDKSGTLLLDLTTENSGLSIDAPTGTVFFIITGTQSEGLPLGVHDYSLFVMSGATREPLIHGQITVLKNPTQFS